MGDGTELFAFFLTSLAIELTPGPNMAYLALVGVSRGRGDGFMAVLGVPSASPCSAPWSASAWAR